MEALGVGKWNGDRDRIGCFPCCPRTTIVTGTSFSPAALSGVGAGAASGTVVTLCAGTAAVAEGATATAAGNCDGTGADDGACASAGTGSGACASADGVVGMVTIALAGTSSCAGADTTSEAEARGDAPAAAAATAASEAASATAAAAICVRTDESGDERGEGLRGITVEKKSGLKTKSSSSIPCAARLVGLVGLTELDKPALLLPWTLAKAAFKTSIFFRDGGVASEPSTRSIPLRPRCNRSIC